jgi:aminocarboxymuconate-semialdehyde decarboxylase
MFDVHAHALSESLLDTYAKAGTHGLSRDPDGDIQTPWGQLDLDVFRFEPRFERMDEMGVERQVITPIPGFTTWGDWAANVEEARALNASIAECVEVSDGRFEGFASLALGEPEQAVEELTRAIDEHGFTGAFIGTHAGGRHLDDPAFEPLWTELGRLGIPVFMHPMSAEPTPRWDEFTLTTAIYWPNETALAVGRLIFAGVLERHPGLTLVLSHGGGTLAFLRGRLDLAYHAPKYEYNADCQANISKPPTDYLKQLYYDTAVASPESLHFLIDLFGADHVLFGTDDPFEIGDTGGTIALPAIRERTRDEQEQITGGTLTRLLGR